MIKNKLVLCFIPLTLAALFISSALAWTNPAFNPPAGGGVIDAESGAPRNAIHIIMGGNVGIGTTTPLSRLHVAGDITQDNTNVLRARNSAGAPEVWMWPRWSDNVMYTNFGAGGWNIRNNASTNVMFMTSAGNVGIGTTTPGARLEIAAPTSGATMNVGRVGGQPSIKGLGDWLILDAPTGGRLGLNLWESGNVIIALGGGNVGIGTMTPGSLLQIAGNENTARLGIDTGAEYMEIAQDEWGASYGLLFNAFKTNPGVSGPLFVTGNTAYRRDAGVSGRAATAIGGFLNDSAGGHIQLFSAPPGTAGANIAWTQIAGFSRTATWLSPRGTSSDLHVNSAGNVGIGTTAPGARLHIADGGFRHGGVGEINIDAPGVIGGRLRILDNGNVGIGTTAPVARLDVRGTIASSGSAGIFTTPSYSTTGWQIVTVTFPTAFSSTPKVVVTNENWATGDFGITQIRIANITGTSFQISFFINAVGIAGTTRFHWIAIQ